MERRQLNIAFSLSASDVFDGAYVARRPLLCLSPLGSFSFVAYNCFSLSHPSPFLRVAVSSFLLTSRRREEERGMKMVEFLSALKD